MMASAHRGERERGGGEGGGLSRSFSVVFVKSNGDEA